MLRGLLIGLIRFYQTAISPWTPQTCRFVPSCSAYARDAIDMHGVGKGGVMALRRILRCHPWGGQGYDPVPVRERPVGVGTNEEAGSHIEKTATSGPRGRPTSSDL